MKDAVKIENWVKRYMNHNKKTFREEPLGNFLNLFFDYLYYLNTKKRFKHHRTIINPK